MSSPVPSGFLFNDPEYHPFGVAWLRGITPLRLAAVAAVCAMVAARPTLWNISTGNAFAAIQKLVLRAAIPQLRPEESAPRPALP